MTCICLFSLIAGIVVFAAVTRRKFFKEWWNKRAEWYRVVMRCRVSLICVILVVGSFVALPPAQDILRSMAQPKKGWNIVWFELLLFVWAFVVWYGGRILLNYDFDAIRDKGRKTTNMQLRTLWGENVWPRILGVIGIFGVGTCAMWNAVSGIGYVKEMNYRLIWWVGVANIVL